MFKPRFRPNPVRRFQRKALNQMGLGFLRNVGPTRKLEYKLWNGLLAPVREFLRVLSGKE